MMEAVFTASLQPLEQQHRSRGGCWKCGKAYSATEFKRGNKNCDDCSRIHRDSKKRKKGSQRPLEPVAGPKGKKKTILPSLSPPLPSSPLSPDPCSLPLVFSDYIKRSGRVHQPIQDTITTILVTSGGIWDGSSRRLQGGWQRSALNPRCLPSLYSRCDICPDFPSRFKFRDFVDSLAEDPLKFAESLRFMRGSPVPKGDSDAGNLAKALNDYRNTSPLPTMFVTTEATKIDCLPPTIPVAVDRIISQTMEYRPVDNYYDFFYTPENTLSDFHTDGAEAAFVIVIEGQKLFMCWPPTPENLEVIGKHGSKDNRLVHWAKQLVDPIAVVLDDSMVLFMPHGTIHAVLSLTSSMMVSLGVVDVAAIGREAQNLRFDRDNGTSTDTGVDRCRKSVDQILERSCNAMYPLALQSLREIIQPFLVEIDAEASGGAKKGSRKKKEAEPLKWARSQIWELDERLKEAQLRRSRFPDWSNDKT